MTSNNDFYNHEKEKSKQTIFNDESSSNGPTSTGLEQNIAGLLCYLFSIVTGILFLILEKENRFIRFHAMQAVITFIFFAGISIVLNFIPIIGLLISLLLGPVGFFLTIFLMIQAYQGKKYKLPYIGDLAEQYSEPK